MSFRDNSREESYDPSYNTRERFHESFPNPNLPEEYAAYGTREPIYDEYNRGQGRLVKSFKE